MLKPNVCFTICALSSSGGTERVSTIIANQLATCGYNITFVSEFGNKEPYFPLNKKIKLFRIIRNKMEHKMRHIPGYVQYRYQKILRQQKIDVVIDVGTLMAEISAEACCKLGIKLISWDHFNFTCMQNDTRMKNVMQLMHKYSSQLVVLTKDDRQMYLENTNFKPEFITQIYNPLSLNIFEFTPHNNNKVLAVGRFMPQKGFDILLKIWAKVESQISDWSLDIIGDDGSDEAGLHGIKESLNLQRVSLLPATKDIITKYREASIYVLSSRFEGFPMVLLEATAMSLPIVAFNCKTGPSEIVTNGQNGYLVEQNDLDDFVHKLINLMKDGELRQNMGRKSFEISKRFTMESVLPQWQNLLLKIKQI